MPIKEKLPGRCSVQLPNGEYCGRKVTGGDPICKFHARQPKRMIPGIMKSTGSTALDKLPPERRREVVEAYENPNLLSIRPDVALLEARRGELAARVETGESGAAWIRLNEIMDDFDENSRTMATAREAGDTDLLAELQAKQIKLLEENRAIIRRRGANEAASTELIDFTHQLASLKKCELTRLSMLHEMMTQDDAIIQARTLTAVVLANIADEALRIKIAYEFRERMAEIHRRGVRTLEPLGSHKPNVSFPASLSNGAVVD